MANYYELDYFVSIRINFTYANYGERVGDKKSKFWSGDGRIEDHWVK